MSRGEFLAALCGGAAGAALLAACGPDGKPKDPTQEPPTEEPKPTPTVEAPLTVDGLPLNILDTPDFESSPLRDKLIGYANYSLQPDYLPKEFPATPTITSTSGYRKYSFQDNVNGKDVFIVYFENPQNGLPIKLAVLVYDPTQGEFKSSTVAKQEMAKYLKFNFKSNSQDFFPEAHFFIDRTGPTGTSYNPVIDMPWRNKNGTVEGVSTFLAKTDAVYQAATVFKTSPLYPRNTSYGINRLDI
jgi:hypothetical protein